MNSIFCKFKLSSFRFYLGWIRRSIFRANLFTKDSSQLKVPKRGSRIELSLVTFAKKHRWSRTRISRRFFFFMYNSRVNLLERTVIGELENRWKIFFFHSQSWMKILSKLLIGKYFKTFRANLSPCNLYSSLYTSVKIGSEIWILIGSSFREINDFNSFATSDFFAAHGIRERSSMAAFTPHCKPECFHDVRKKNFPRIIYNTLAFNYTLESNNITKYNNNC